MERAHLARLLGGADAAPPIDPAQATVIEERDPARFMPAFQCAVAGSGPIFLADPAWGPAERSALRALLGAPVPVVQRGWLMVPSGGTAGRLKFARHDSFTLTAAVRGFCARHGVERVNCVNVLPLHHVSGLMGWMRSALTGGEFIAWDWKLLEAGVWPEIPEGGRGWYLSLVPTQLQRLLSEPEAAGNLRRFDAVFVGGGPMWPGLAAAAAEAQIPVCLCYGMTETAAMVAAQAPADFLAGDRSCGNAFPHARVEVGEDGSIRVSGESVFRGYYPEECDGSVFQTGDLGRWDDCGRLNVLGRRDAAIISGGEKVDPLEVEAALRSSGEFSDVAVIGVPDPDWGEAVVAFHPAKAPGPNPGRIAAALEPLAAFKRPRRYVAVADWPRNAQGKLDRARLRAGIS